MTAVIADDEPLLRGQLRESLAALWPELQVVGEAGHGEEAVMLIARHQPGIAFLDIEMPGMNGLQAAAQVKGTTHIVFITAYDRYAVEAFDRGAVDYVLKPASEMRLAEAVARLKSRVMQSAPTAFEVAETLARVAAALGKANVNRLRWIQASVGQQLRLIRVEDVVYFESDLKYTRVVTVDGESLIRRTLKELLTELDPQAFWQIRRSTVVNIEAVAYAVRDAERITLVLKRRPERLDVSRSYAHRFRGM